MLPAFLKSPSVELKSMSNFLSIHGNENDSSVPPDNDENSLPSSNDARDLELVSPPSEKASSNTHSPIMGQVPHIEARSDSADPSCTQFGPKTEPNMPRTGTQEALKHVEESEWSFSEAEKCPHQSSVDASTGKPDAKQSKVEEEDKKWIDSLNEMSHLPHSTQILASCLLFSIFRFLFSLYVCDRFVFSLEPSTACLDHFCCRLALSTVGLRFIRYVYRTSVTSLCYRARLLNRVGRVNLLSNESCLARSRSYADVVNDPRTLLFERDVTVKLSLSCFPFHSSLDVRLEIRRDLKFFRFFITGLTPSLLSVLSRIPLLFRFKLGNVGLPSIVLPLPWIRPDSYYDLLVFEVDYDTRLLRGGQGFIQFKMFVETFMTSELILKTDPMYILENDLTKAYGVCGGGKVKRKPKTPKSKIGNLAVRKVTVFLLPSDSKLVGAKRRKRSGERVLPGKGDGMVANSKRRRLNEDKPPPTTTPTPNRNRGDPPDLFDLSPIPVPPPPFYDPFLSPFPSTDPVAVTLPPPPPRPQPQPQPPAPAAAAVHLGPPIVGVPQPAPNPARPLAPLRPLQDFFLVPPSRPDRTNLNDAQDKSTIDANQIRGKRSRGV